MADSGKPSFSGLVARRGLTEKTTSATPTPEICHSPSWSDYNKPKPKQEQKKAEKERKEGEKRRKKDEEKQRSVQLKATKRLSKKPPAAMDTQRMPVALMRPSARAESQAEPSSESNSRSSSREGRRSSISSLASLLRLTKESRNRPSRSQSMPPEPHVAISTSAPQLGKLRGIETHSRTPSSGTYGGSDSDQEYVKQLVGFAYQVKAMVPSPDEIDVEVKELNSARLCLASAQPSSPSAPTLYRSDDKRVSDTDLRKKSERSFPPTTIARGTKPEEYFDRKENNDKTAVASRRAQPDEIASSHSDGSAGNVGPAAVHSIVPSPIKPPVRKEESPISRSSHDGNSYVQKQRMYWQQQLMAGYEDDLAFELAKTLHSAEAATNAQERVWPPTPQDSSESVGKDRSIGRQEVESPPRVAERPNSKESTSSSTDNAAEYHHYMSEQPQKLRGKSANTLPAISKVEKILGERLPNSESPPPHKRRPKPDHLPSRDIIEIIPVTPSNWVTPAQSDPGMYVYRNPMHNVSVQNYYARESSIPIDHPERPRPEKCSIDSTAIPSPGLPKFSVTPVLPPLVPQPNGTVPEPRKVPSFNDSLSTAGPYPDSETKQNTVTKEESQFAGTGADWDGLTRKASLKRPRSDPEIQTSLTTTNATLATTTNNATTPTFDFLPALKHQPLVKPKRVMPNRVSFADTPVTIPSSSSLSSSSPLRLPRSALSADLSIPTPNGPLAVPGMSKPTTVSPAMRRPAPVARLSRSGLMGPATLPLTSNGGAVEDDLNTKPLAKMFVICCKCKYWHDMPSRLYEAMALPRKITDADEAVESVGATANSKKAADRGKDKGKEQVKGKAKMKEIESKVVTTVTCPWCEHEMSTSCCAGWTAIVYLHERHH
ncbi:hypothetical protein MMC19_007057 [Ptychographa xylographoides]|nr:hypothetical protein [Ptychographa xylographoides]